VAVVAGSYSQFHYPNVIQHCVLKFLKAARKDDKKTHHVEYRRHLEFLRIKIHKS
jgi:hypothetical protein